MVPAFERKLSERWMVMIHWSTSIHSALQELISRLDSRTLRPINVLGLLVFSNNTKNGISDIRDTKRRIMACLEIWLKGNPRSLEMTPFDRSQTCSYSSSIVTMAASCTVFEIKRDIGRKTTTFHTLLVFNLHDPPMTPSSPWATRRCKILPKSSSLPRVQQSYRQTTGRRQTDGSCHKPNVT